MHFITIFSFTIGKITNVKYINFIVSNEKNIIFLKEFKGKLAKIFIFLIKLIYNILCIIKKYIKFRNYSFSFKQTFSNPIFSTLHTKK